jgi:hypothetical protein
MTATIPGSDPGRDIPLTLVTGLFWAFLGIAVVLALSILILPGDTFLMISNYLQILAAIAGSLALLFLYNRSGKPAYLLYAAGALGLWGASNIAWYVNILLGRRSEVYPGLIDMGIIASILVLGIAYQHAFPRRQVKPHILLGILALILVTPIAVIATSGVTSQTLVTLLYFFGCASLIVTGLNHSLRSYPLILAGTLLFAIAFMIYPIRETFFLTSSFLNIIGTFVVIGFSLIVIGFIAANPKPEPM